MMKKGRKTPKPNRSLAHIKIGRASPTDCIKAAAAPQRRRILRALHAAGEARSPNELSGAIEASIGHVSYHVKVLKECGAVALTDTQPRRGAVEHYYGSTVVDNKLISMLLEATREDDE